MNIVKNYFRKWWKLFKAAYPYVIFFVLFTICFINTEGAHMGAAGLVFIISIVTVGAFGDI